MTGDKKINPGGAKFQQFGFGGKEGLPNE